MPKTLNSTGAALSDEFRAEWNRPTYRHAAWEIRYKRRYWNGSAYVWEAAYSTLSAGKVSKISNISWKLDAANAAGQFLASNVTLTLKDFAREWLPSNNVDGKWKATSTATLGFEPFLSRFEVLYSYRLPDDTFEKVVLFTGFSEAPVLDTKTGTIDIRLVGREVILESADAQKVETTYSGRAMTDLGDNSQVIFDTELESLWDVTSGTVFLVDPMVVSNGSNDAIDFDEGGGELNATLAAGTYAVGASDADAGTMCAQIKTQLEAAGADTYSVTFSYVTKKFTIVKDGGGTFNLLWSSGTNTATAADSLLGFDTTDETGATTYTSDSAIATTSQTQGTDYTLSDTNEGDTTAKVTFEVGSEPPTKSTIVYDARQWKRNQQISTLAGLLCDEAGIGAGERTIEEPIFGSVDQSQTINSQAEWEEGTLSNVETKRVPGSITADGPLFDDFSDNDYTNDPTWTVLNRPEKISAASGKLVASPFGGAVNPLIYVDYGDVFDVLEAKVGFGNGAYFFMMSNNSHSSGQPQGNGYGLGVTGTSIIRFFRVDGGSAVILADNLALSGTKTIKITRDSSGNWKIYLDGVLQASVTDNTYTAGQILMLQGQAATGSDQTLDDIHIRFPSVHKYTSKEFDLLSAPTEWLPASIDETLNGGTVTIKTQTTATSGSGYEAETTVDGSLTPQSTKQRYFRWVIYITISSVNISPEIGSITLNWRSGSLFVTHADFSGLNTFEGIRELAELGGMEFGFEGDGTFFFRNKAVSGSADFTLNERNVLSKISALDPGIAGVVNVSQVRYGEYYSEFNSTDAGESEPTSQQKYKDRIKSVSLSRFLFANNANIALAVATKNYSGTPKRTANLQGRIVPHMNLADKAEVSWSRDPKLNDVVGGDDMWPAGVYPPGPTSDGKPPSNVVLNGVNFKMVGISFNVMKATQRTQVEEIL